MAGRKPKPTAVKKLEGNPGKRKLNTKEPIPAKGMGRATAAAGAAKDRDIMPYTFSSDKVNQISFVVTVDIKNTLLCVGTLREMTNV